MTGTAKARAAARATVTTPSEREIHIERVFDAPREQVWQALTDPALLRQWWGRGHELVIERFELERGGHWRFVEHEGGRTHGFEGRFAEIEAPTRIVQSFEWDGMPAHASLQTMTLHDLGDGRTRLVTEVRFMTPAERDAMIESGMESGLNETYAALDRILSHAV